MNLARRLALLALSLSLLQLTSFGQTIFGSLTGTIYDSSGAIIPDATVIVRNLDTGIARELKSSASGT
jgi:hypothetical protein